MMADNVKSRVLRADGTYERRGVMPGEKRVDAQQTFLRTCQAVSARPRFGATSQPPVTGGILGFHDSAAESLAIR